MLHNCETWLFLLAQLDATSLLSGIFPRICGVSALKGLKQPSRNQGNYVPVDDVVSGLTEEQQQVRIMKYISNM